MTNVGRGAALVAALTVGWLVGGMRTDRLQAESVSSDAGTAMTVMPSPTGGEHVVYLLDGKRQAVSVYSYDVRKEKMRLSAVRKMLPITSFPNTITNNPPSRTLKG